MHNLLTKWLQKHGVDSPDKLDNAPMPDGSPTELETFQEMTKILSKEDLTVGDIKEFCEKQVSIIENKWSDLELNSGKKAEFIPYHTVYKKLINVIESDSRVREALEKELEKLTE